MEHSATCSACKTGFIDQNSQIDVESKPEMLKMCSSDQEQFKHFYVFFLNLFYLLFVLLSFSYRHIFWGSRKENSHLPSMCDAKQ